MNELISRNNLSLNSYQMNYKTWFGTMRKIVQYENRGRNHKYYVHLYVDTKDGLYCWSSIGLHDEDKYTEVIKDYAYNYVDIEDRIVSKFYFDEIYGAPSEYISKSTLHRSSNHSYEYHKNITKVLSDPSNYKIIDEEEFNSYKLMGEIQ